MINFSDLVDAFYFLSSSSPGRPSAYLCRDTGEIIYRSETGRQYKALLETEGLLESCYEFEGQREKQALMERCEEKEVKVSD